MTARSRLAALVAVLGAIAAASVIAGFLQPGTTGSADETPLQYVDKSGVGGNVVVTPLEIRPERIAVFVSGTDPEAARQIDAMGAVTRPDSVADLSVADFDALVVDAEGAKGLPDGFLSSAVANHAIVVGLGISVPEMRKAAGSAVNDSWDLWSDDDPGADPRGKSYSIFLIGTECDKAGVGTYGEDSGPDEILSRIRFYAVCVGTDTAEIEG